METSLFEAINASSLTNNGALTYSSSLSKNIDFFFLAGASRGKDLIPVFASALAEDKNVAVRILQWTRDARGGAGERDTFKKLFSYLIKTDVEVADKILPTIVEIGRWDDVFVAFNTKIEHTALRLINDALKNKNGLCAKWCPRQGAIANKIRAYLKLTPKEYRKLVVGLSSTVEQKMCANNWLNIEYAHVPSIAAGRYQKAFKRHDGSGYEAYKTALVAGTTKINASVAYPYDVIRSMRNGDTTVSDQQWKALPNYLEGSNENILPIVDVSGSMDSVSVSGSITALDVAISLGLYISERSEGLFKDQFITFSGKPKMVKVSGTLHQRYNQMSQSDWGMNTDLQAVFKLVLDSAKKHNVPASQMPTKLLILSDMEFDVCVSNGTSVNSISMIAEKYKQSGYELPNVIFWNLNGRSGNVPVKFNESGTALVSGSSPAIVKSILGGTDITPESIMMKTVFVDRYSF